MPLRNLAAALGLALAALLAAAAPVSAQMGVLVYEWNPKVGSGASYQMETDSRNTELQLSVVGKEDVDGKTGYWIELTNVDTNSAEKDLMVAVDDRHTHIARSIIQQQGKDPVEGPPTTPQSVNPVLFEVADFVARENVATPAGTYSCEHFRARNGKWEAWFSKEITPFGLVKMTYDSGAEMVVVSPIADAKDHITGTPQKAAPQSDPAAH